MRAWTAAGFAAALLVPAGAALLVPAGASAFQLIGATWDGGDAPLHVGAIEDDELREAFVDAVHEWEDASDFDFALIFDDEGACDRDFFSGAGPLKNGAELAALDCDGMELGADTLAVTITAADGDEFVAMGMVFNDAFDWMLYDGPWRSGEPDLRRIALHELGHWEGLAHEVSAPAIMHPFAGDLVSLQPDDVAGARFLYGPSGPKPPPEPNTLPPEVVCRRAELRAAATLCRAQLRCEAKRAGKPAKDPAGATRDACAAGAAARFDARFQDALNAACLWQPAVAAARAGVVDPLLALESGLLDGADPASSADAKLRKALLAGAARACGDGFAAEVGFAKHQDAARRAKQRGAAADGFVQRAEHAVARASAEGVAYGGTSPADGAAALGALVDDFAADAAGN